MEKYPALSSISNEIADSYRILSEFIKTEEKILTCGNGGSAADTEHIVGELMKGFRLRRELNVKQNKKIVELYPD